MNSLDQQFTDKLYANYEANVKYAAIENAVSHNGLLTSLEKRNSAAENNPVFSIDLTKDKVSNQKLLVAAGCLQRSIHFATK